MRHLFTTRIRVLIIVAVLLAAGLAVLSNATGMSVPGMMVQGFLAPFRAGANALTGSAEQFYSYMFRYETLAAENEALKAQIAEMEDKIVAYEEMIKHLQDNPIVVNPVAPEIELDLIKSDIQEIAELATMQYLFTDAARFSDSAYLGDWKVPFTEKSFTLKWDGVIKAGVNLENVQISVDESAMKIVVTLPAAQILSYEIDNESIEKLDEKNNVFNPISVDDKVTLDTATEKEMRERAIQNGLLEDAWENAKDIIARLLTANAAIGDAYTIEFVME